MRLISKVTKLKSDISESRVVSNLMEDFPPICKKDNLAVQMALIADYYETHGKLISLDEVPEEMYGGELPLAKSRKSRRKDLIEEEYLAEEQPSKKAKKSKIDKALEKEAEESDQSRVLGKRTREGQEMHPLPFRLPEAKKESYQEVGVSF